MGVSASVQDRFDLLLTATGLTNSAFSNTIDAAYRLSNLGEFATEAKTVLKSIEKYAGQVGTIINVVDVTIDAYRTGFKTKEDAIEILSNISGVGAGGLIAGIPFVGGILALVYYHTESDVMVQNYIKNLIITHFPEEDENTPPGNQGPGL